jgi:hypothetical protein
LRETTFASLREKKTAIFAPLNIYGEIKNGIFCYPDDNYCGPNAENLGKNAHANQPYRLSI